MLLWIPVTDESSINGMVLDLSPDLANYLLDVREYLAAAPPPTNQRIEPGAVRLRMHDMGIVRLFTGDIEDLFTIEALPYADANEIHPTHEPPRDPINDWLDDSLTQLALMPTEDGGFSRDIYLGIIVVVEDEGIVYSDDIPWRHVLQAAGVRL
jgi:hypothetical protein